MKTNKIFELPIPSSGCGDVRFISSGIDCLVEFEYRKSGVDYIGGIRFKDVVAYRFRDEMRSDGYADDAYGALSEILESDWKKELKKIEPSGISSVSVLRHFAVFLRSNGYFEVMARECSLEREKTGLLENC